MAKNNRKITKILIIVAVLITAGTIAILVYNKKKKNPKETVASAVSSAVTSGYVPESFPLRKGMWGNNVRALQGALMWIGYSVGKWGTDGKFGDDTLKAVREAFKNPTKTEVTEAEWKPYYNVYTINNNLPTTTYNG